MVEEEKLGRTLPSLHTHYIEKPKKRINLLGFTISMRSMMFDIQGERENNNGNGTTMYMTEQIKTCDLTI